MTKEFKFTVWVEADRIEDAIDKLGDVIDYDFQDAFDLEDD